MKNKINVTWDVAIQLHFAFAVLLTNSVLDYFNAVWPQWLLSLLAVILLPFLARKFFINIV